LRILIVEDEHLIARRLERFCREILGERLETLRVVTAFDEASARLAEMPIDLLLLDLNLNGRNGMELLQASVAGSFHTIIVSANVEQALKAFEYGVLDFVPKPFTPERFAQALKRVTDAEGRAAHAAKFLAVRKYGNVKLIPIDEVLYAQGAGAYAELVLGDGSRELHDKTLEKLHALLPPVFERIHKSYVVRLTAVVALHAQEATTRLSSRMECAFPWDARVTRIYAKKSASAATTNCS